MPQMSDEELYALPAVVDLRTAARVLGIGTTKAYELARAGEFPCTLLRLGSRYRIAKTELLRVIGATREQPAEPTGDGTVVTGDEGEVPAPAYAADTALAEHIEQLAAALTAVVSAVIARALAGAPARAEVPEADAPVLLTYERACRRLGISLSTLYRLLREGAIRSVTLSAHVHRIPAAELDRYVAALLAAEGGQED